MIELILSTYSSIPREVKIVLAITLCFAFVYVPMYSFWRIPGMKKVYCKIGWHSYPQGFTYTGFDGASAHSTCKWCLYKGMTDSQGNLF